MKPLLTFLCFIFLSACAQKKVKDPLSLNWIKEYIENTKKSPFPTQAIITQYTYQGETVFLVNGCYNCADALQFLYNENKEQLCVFGGMVANSNNCPDFFKKATDKKIVWKNFKE